MCRVQVFVMPDSICAADDLHAPHEFRFTLSEKTQLHELFELLVSQYLPNISGQTEQWDAYIQSKLVGSIGKDLSCHQFNLSQDTELCDLVAPDGTLRVQLSYLLD